MAMAGTGKQPDNNDDGPPTVCIRNCFVAHNELT